MSAAIPKASLCGCLVDSAFEDVPNLLRYPEVDLVEWRLDMFIQRRSFDETMDALSCLKTSERRPVLATNRPQREMGCFEGSEDLRFQALAKAVEAGAEWVDVEADVDAAAFAGFRSGSARILLSHHDYRGTPDRATLRRLAEEMAGKRPSAIKIVTYARSPEDNLRTLDLIPFGKRELNMDVIAFCMGPHGKWSRFACLMLGSLWTYVQMPGQLAAAPGQFTAAEMRSLLASADWMAAE